MASAIPPTSACAVVFNRVLLVRLIRFALAILVRQTSKKAEFEI
jgi:hypothetical protein